MNPNTSHAFNVAEAVAYGVESAILLNNVRFWLANNKANKKNDHEGFWWTYNSGAAFSELFPYMKERSISRNLKTLCDAGILQSGCFNKMKYDRTLWYTIPLEFAVNSPQAAPLTICQNGEWNNQNTQPLQPAPSLNSEIQTPPQAAPLTICQNGEWISQNGEWISQNGEPIPDINTDIKPDINKSVVVVTREESFIDVGNHSQERARDLTGKEMTLTTEQGECKNWASTQNYWATCTASNEEFLKVWCKPNQTLRKQFDAHKKALQDGLGQTGHSYTSSKTNRTGGNYAPSTSKSNKHNDFTKAGYYENGGFNADGSF